MTPEDSIRVALARKTAKSIVDHGSIPMATLKESIILHDKVDEILAKEIQFPEQAPFPEFPEYPSEMAISNLPDVQKVELVNPPKEKDAKEQLKLLKQIADEIKKKEQYAYDIEIDSTLKEQLRGEKGEGGINGINGLNGKDGSPDTAEEVRDKLSSLKGEERLDAKHIKNLPQGRVGGVMGIKEIVAGSGVTVDNSNIGYPVVSVAVNTDSFGIVVDGAGTAITTGSKGSKYIPWDCTVTGWDIRSDVSGSCVFDVKRSGTSLAGSEKPTLSGASSNQDLALSTWTTSLSAGDVVEFVVDSASTVTRATVTILVSKI